MPARYIREGLASSGDIAKLSYQGEVLYTHLLLVVDDFGRLELGVVNGPDDKVIPEDGIRTIRAECLRHRPDFTDEAIRKELMEFEKLGFVKYYIAKGSRGRLKMYLQVEEFNQRIRSASKCPPPPGYVDYVRGKRQTPLYSEVSFADKLPEGAIPISQAPADTLFPLPIASSVAIPNATTDAKVELKTVTPTSSTDTQNANPEAISTAASLIKNLYTPAKSETPQANSEIPQVKPETSQAKIDTPPAFSSKTKTYPDTVNEVIEAAVLAGKIISPENAEKFLNHYHAINWMVNGSKISNWRFKLNEWIINGSTFSAKNGNSAKNGKSGKGPEDNRGDSNDILDNAVGFASSIKNDSRYCRNEF